jgi:rare lipoprotein A
VRAPGLAAAACSVALSVLLGGCATARPALPPGERQPAVAVVPAPVTDQPPAPIPGPVAPVLEVETGVASYYANSLAGRRTASGEPYDPDELVAAHRHLPFGTILRVTDPASGRSVQVRVIDRGPFTPGRVLDVSWRAAEELGMIRRGLLRVYIEVLAYGS